LVVDKLCVFPGDVEFLGHQVRDVLANNHIGIKFGSVNLLRKDLHERGIRKEHLTHTCTERHNAFPEWNGTPIPDKDIVANRRSSLM
jgi:hypothetical protein